jgi:phosphoglycerate kinase
MSLNVKNVDSLSFAGKKALIRVDFNVPLDEHFQVTDNTRIQAAVPTIKKILNDGGSAILMSHLGRPKGGPEDKYSLKHIVSAVEAALGQKISFANDCIGVSQPKGGSTRCRTGIVARESSVLQGGRKRR